MSEDSKATYQKDKKVKPPKKITKSYLQNSGLYYLQRFAASEEHFKDVMRNKIKRSLAHHGAPKLGECEEWLEQVVQSFVSLGYLDDERYAKGLVQSLRLKGRSATQVQLRLKKAKLDSQLIEQTIEIYNLERLKDFEQLDLPTNWPDVSAKTHDYIAALKCCKKRRIGPYESLSRAPKPYDKSVAILARNGFSYDIAQTVLRTDMNEAEDFLLEAQRFL